MICQVCKKNVLSELTLCCPCCKTDLAVLYQLEDVQEKYVKNAKYRTLLEGNIAIQKDEKDKQIRKWKYRSTRFATMFLLFPLLYKCCTSPTKNDAAAVQYALMQRDSLFRYTEILQAQVIDLQRDTSALTSTKVKSIKHTLTEGETLSQLGTRFFNDKKAGYRIAKDNRLTAIEYAALPVGKTLIINFR